MSAAASLASRLQQNWMAKYPYDSLQIGGNLDDSLTSLSWLQNLKVSEMTQPRQNSNSYGYDGNKNLIKQEVTSPTVLTVQHTRPDSRVPVGEVAPPGCLPEGVDYKNNPYIKPPFSYASLICMAMKATKKNKITLSSIYNWITDNFMYYRHTEPSWQNSIRHNLSLNKCFEKVPRRKDEPGKGGFWRINPDYCDMVENGVFKKRRGSRENIPSPPVKRLRQEDEDYLSVVGLKSSTREDKLLSNGSTNFFGEDDDEEENSLTLREDFNWTSILSQQINIDGRSIKTEQILDDTESSPFLALSPPSSETNSDDLGLDDLFSTSDTFSLRPDFHTNDPLDLTVHGVTIKPPDWWSSDDNALSSRRNNNTTNYNNRGLHTPRSQTPEPDHSDSLWGDSLGLGSSGNQFDIEKLFEFGIPSPQM
ncbi:forkhead box protein J1-B [Biomphalaria pfeifferi]|uniref:Forkhead box protein J1-B n=1 Tax=Biomphalaria pfeifferi TaxID=112525 RepID=A0AAD8BBZ9_BIOPF|nr:forkhead box protein J1-B [Biomphalaria pfeifferi]